MKLLIKVNRETTKTKKMMGMVCEINMERLARNV